MLTEDDVVLAVCDWLTNTGWTILSRALATERGDDVVARNHTRTLRVEAKGGGSSKEGTRRYGKEFTLGQCQINVAMATLRAMKVASARTDVAAVAFPDTANYRRVVEPVLPALTDAAITVLLVSPEKNVQPLPGPASGRQDTSHPFHP